jgi:hypothetical protein
VQNEDDALGRRQTLEHDGEGQPDAVFERDPIGRIGHRVPGFEIVRWSKGFPAGGR